VPEVLGLELQLARSLLAVVVSGLGEGGVVVEDRPPCHEELLVNLALVLECDTTLHFSEGCLPLSELGEPLEA